MCVGVTVDVCSVTKSSAPKRTVVDYSSPNIAKEMHVVSLVPSLQVLTVWMYLPYDIYDVVT